MPQLPVTNSPSRRRRRLRLSLVTALLLSAAGTAAVTAAAQDPPSDPNGYGLTGSGFEVLDGNMTVDGSDAYLLDWNALNTSNPADTRTATIDTDAASGSGDNAFGNGTKEDTAVPSPVSGSIPPNKSDLKEFGSWIERNANGAFLHLFWTRVQDPTGTTNMDFEFNQKRCTTSDTSGCSTNGVTPTRTAGDLLITYDLSNGGTHPTISLRTWGGSAWGAVDALDAGKATGSINGTAISTPTLTGNSYSPRTFGEASINVGEIFKNDTACRSFGGAYLKSRSSDAFNSAVKDFIAPIGIELSNCGRIDIEKADDSSPPTAVAGATFAVHKNSAATDPLLRPTEDRTTLAGALTAAATSVTVVDGGKIPAETALIKIDSEYLRITGRSGNTLTVERGASANGTASSTAAAHSGPSGSTLGATVIPVASCTTAGSSTSVLPDPTGTVATCSIPNLHFGSYWVVETKAPAGYQRSTAVQAVSVTAQTTPVVVPYTDNRAPATVKVTKVDDTLGPLGGAVFYLYNDLDHDRTLSTGDTKTAYTCTTKTSVTATTTDPIGTCRITGINEPGDYIVHEETAPAGYDKADDQALTIELGATYDLADLPGHGAFQDLKRYTVIVLVCRESDHTLYGSSVALPTPTPTVTSVTGTSLSGTTLPSEAQLCGADGLAGLTGTSVYPGKRGGTHTASVSITPTPVPVPSPTATP
jgi:hypothetical protein